MIASARFHGKLVSTLCLRTGDKPLTTAHARPRRGRCQKSAIWRSQGCKNSAKDSKCKQSNDECHCCNNRWKQCRQYSLPKRLLQFFLSAVTHHHLPPLRATNLIAKPSQSSWKPIKSIGARRLGRNKALAFDVACGSIPVNCNVTAGFLMHGCLWGRCPRLRSRENAVPGNVTAGFYCRQNAKVGREARTQLCSDWQNYLSVTCSASSQKRCFL